MEVRRHARVGHVGIVDDEGVGRFGEEEGQFAIRVGAHFAGVFGVVAPDAEDAADREGAAAGGLCDRDGGDERRGDDVALHGGVLGGE